jgi:rhodanese-related sulfurtransferase
MPRTIDAATLKAWINDGRELAILDAREDGEFGKSHLFWAVPCALSKVELRARQLLPRRGTRIACVDGGEGGLAETLAAFLEGIGCTDVHVLAGGTQAWAAAGYVLFSGMNVPSKAFGEWVEHHYETPSVDPGELKAMIEAGTDMVILDSRPMDEFRRMSIPGAIDVPGGELVYRIGEIAPDPATTIVVNCAGRTRSIMGAESLRAAGVPNRVVALRNGTMGWELAGFSCDRGKAVSFPEGTPDSLPTALQRATHCAGKWGVQTLDAAGLAALQADASRTTYLLDVRDPAEFAAGHLPGSRSAPGGQLVQGTDNWVAVRNARIVLVDDTSVRARMTGAWLRQLGRWEVYVLEGGLGGALTTAATAPDWASLAAEAAATPITAADLARAQDAVILQLSRSLDFREAHIPGALWAVRTRLARHAGRLRAARLVVLAAPEEAYARMAVDEARRLAPDAAIRVLAGGLAAWTAAGQRFAADRRNPQDADCIDAYLRPYDRNDGVEDAMREYLSWEIDLVNDIRRDGDARFGEV